MGRGKRRARTGTEPARAVAEPELVIWPGEEPVLSDPEALAAVERLAALAPEELGRRLAGGLIVDLDDTLNVNLTLFLRSRGLLVPLFRELDREGRDDYRLAFEHREISNALVPRYGFTPTRWREGALEAARHFAGRELSGEERRRVLEAAEEGLGIGDLYPGVPEALALLKEAAVPMALLTKGEEAKQREKISGHGLERFFSAVYVVAEKDGALLQRVAGEAGLRSPAVIGDSERSDVVPAREAGFRAVLVDRELRWQLERDEGAGGAERAGGFPQAVALLAGL